MKNLLIVIAAVLAVVLVTQWGSDLTPGAAFSRPPAVVVVDTAVLEPITETLEALGTVRASEAVDVVAKTTGRIKTVHFADNSPVSEGQLIVSLVADSEQAALREAEVNLAEDQRLLRHYQTLAKTNAVSRTLLDEQAAKVKSSEARLALAQAKLDEFEVRAPFSGLLGVRQVSPGTLVTTDTVITTLDDIYTLKLDFSVPERWLARLAPGQTVSASSIAYPDNIFNAQITSLGTRVDAATRALQVHATLANEQGLLRPGMLLNLELQSARRDAVMVNEQAVLQQASTKYVYTVDDKGVVSETPVSTGIRHKGRVEIVSGLLPGQQVVAEGTQKVRAGSVVEVAGTLPGAP
jgi:membrane fusion protein (multidrug efflux system)